MKKLKGFAYLMIVSALSVGVAFTAFAAGDLIGQADSQNVEETVRAIRGMYNQTNSGGYLSRNQQLLRWNGYGYDVVKAAVSTGDAALDRAMADYGYHSYAIEYYYDNPDGGGRHVSGMEGPNFAFAVIDGKEYRYYFSGSSMIRRIGPDGAVIDNPQTNAFLNQIYQVGCRLQNDLSVCSNRSLSQEAIYFSGRHYDMGSHLELYAVVMKGEECGSKAQEYGLYTVDLDTKLGDAIRDEATWREGDDGYRWLNRYLRTESLDGGYMGSLDCLLVDTTGGHVDEIIGIYATH